MGKRDGQDANGGRVAGGRNVGCPGFDLRKASLDYVRIQFSIVASSHTSAFSRADGELALSRGAKRARRMGDLVSCATAASPEIASAPLRMMSREP